MSPEAAARTAGFVRIAGVDEAGRGPWAGPVVAAAVVLTQPRLRVRIDDSKRLTPRARARAFDVILDHAEVGVGMVCAQEIDRRNILRATFLAMQEAVAELPTSPDLILVDGAIAPAFPCSCWPIPHGDQRCYAISCASIVAKVVRDGLMAYYHELYPEYGFDRHKGYGTSFHLEQLRRCGPSALHRFSFRPVAQLIPSA